MQIRNFIYMGIAIFLSACAMQQDRPQENRQELVQAEEAKLNTIVEAFFDEQLVLSPLTATFLGDNRFNDRLAISISPEYQAQFKALEEKYLDRIQQLDKNLFVGQARLTYDVFVYNREISLEGYQYQDNLLAFNQMQSFPNFMAVLGSGSSAQPFQSVQDYNNWLGRVNDFETWMNQAIINFRKGFESGVVHPRPIVE